MIPGSAPALPARGAGLVELPAAVFLRRMPRRRHGTGKNGPGPGDAPVASPRAPRRSAQAVVGRRPAFAGLQLARGIAPLLPRSARAGSLRYRPHARDGAPGRL